MYACICRAVTSEDVTTAIDNGAATVQAVARATRACTGCGTCRERIEAMLGQRDRACPLESLTAA
ncbi:MAG TPA: (2Fe-2S)-binding protein [Trebonia sp.]